MSRRVRVGLAAAVALAVGGGLPHLACKKRAEPVPPSGVLAGHNLLLITLDTTRADRLGCYGHAPAETPTLDSLAAAGALFEQAYAQVPLTLPSHCSMMTGRYPKEFGVRDNGKNALGRAHPTLASIFKEHGYRTAAFVASFVLDSRFGLDGGFELYDDDMGEVSLDRQPLYWQRRGDVVTDRSLAWLEANKNQPFFCWLHYFDPHDPYEPPEPFRSAHAHPYDGEIAFMDAQIKRVVDWMSKAGVAERTLVVIVGDHGESLGEHNYTGHAMFLYETALRVPMIFVHPAAIPPGRRVSVIVEVADVFPTVLDLFGWKAPSGLMTRSLAAGLRGEELDDCEAYAESDFALNAYEWAQQRSLTTPHWKYISSSRPELFDRQTDPGENRNLVDGKPADAAAVLAKLKARYESMVTGVAEEVELDAAARKALEDLGYTGGRMTMPDEFLSAGLPDPKDMLGVLELVVQAEALMTQAKYAEAIPVWQAVLDKFSRRAEVSASLGTCFLKGGDLDQARLLLEQALRVEPDCGLALTSLADLLVERGELEAAVDYYRAALAGRAPNPQIWTKLGDTLSRLGRTDEAVELYRTVLATLPDFPAAHSRLGALLLARGNAQEAVGHFREVLRAHPEDHWTRHHLGLALLQTGDAAEARQHLREAVKADPHYAHAIVKLGTSLADRGDLNRAKETFQAATAFEATAAKAYFYLGMLAARQGDEAGAVTALEQAVGLDPSEKAAVEQLAGYYLSAGRTADAVRVLRSGAEWIRDPHMCSLLATILATSQHDEVRNGREAVSWALRAAELSDKPRPTDLATLAAAYAEAGEFEKAIDTGEGALSAARQAGDTELAEVVRTQLELYRARKPYRHPQF